MIIPPGQAGAEVSDCPDDYIVISGIRLCGERLNDASVNIDFTQNAPVTGISSLYNNLLLSIKVIIFHFTAHYKNVYSKVKNDITCLFP